MEPKYVYLLFISTFCLAYQVLCQSTTYSFETLPPNVAIIKYNQVTLTCYVIDTSSSVTIIWRFMPYPGRDTSINIGSGDGIIDAYSDRFAIEAGTSNLIVKNATAADAGIYVCEHFEKTESRYSELIVLDSTTQCTVNATLSDLRVDDVVLFTCQVEFTGLYAPEMSWQHSNAQSTTANLTTSTQAIYTLTVPITESDNKATVRCRTEFGLAPDGSYDDSWVVSTNIPQITPSIPEFVSAQFNVKYGPSEVTIIDGEASYFPGAVVVCSAEGNPSPTVRWIDTSNNETVHEGTGVAQFTVGAAMEGNQVYKCYAFNELSSVEELLSFEVIVTTPAPTTTASSTTAGNPAPSLTDGEIAGIVIAVIIILILILLLLYCCCFANRKAPSKTTKDKHARLDGVDAVRHPPPPGSKPEVSYISDQGIAPPPYNPYAPPPNRNPEGFMYANLALDDTPRSRKPIQVYEPQEYGNDIRRV